MMDQVARASQRQVDEGWTWKFDPELFTKRFGPFRPSDFAEQLARAACRVAVMNGARSEVVDDDTRAYMAELLAGSPAAMAGVPFVEIPEAHHHIMFDQPLALVTALRAVLATWRPVGTPPAEVVVR
jgi:pimeloyl-ACP methyl ester carboxylesterase